LDLYFEQNRDIIKLMKTNNFLNADNFILDRFPHPLHPDEDGDSGPLYLATSKSDGSVQYVIKGDLPELACNEFMYHKVASALGLYTQEVKLFVNDDLKNAAGIRYVPNATEYFHKNASIENRNAYYAFEALYVILNEEDSREFYLDSNNCLFKLDNSASFNLHLSPEMLKLNELLGNDIFKGVEFLEYDIYEIHRETLIKLHDNEANAPYLETFKHFANLNMNVFDEALEAVGRNYASYVVEYFYRFILRRTESCRQYLDELGIK